MKSYGNMRPNLVCVILAAAVALTPGIVSAGLTVVDYTLVPNTSAAGIASVSLGGTIVTGSSGVTSGSDGGSRGLGISGGTFSPTSDYSLDLGESMTVNYQKLVTNVTADLFDIDPPGNVSYRFEPFNGATSLGIFPIPSHTFGLETKDLWALSGGLAFTSVRFSSTASAPAGLKLVATTFDAVPEPATAVMSLVSGIVLAARSRRRYFLTSRTSTC